MNERLRPKKSFGQHFLISNPIADRIVGFAGLEPEDQVFEIGPGRGILTERLLERVDSVTAVEIDSGLVTFLKGRFGKINGFRLIEQDVLEVDLGKLFGDRTKRIKVVSNIPYNISTPIIELLCRNRAIISEAVLMVQREVARRILSKPGTKQYGLTTLNTALCARGRMLMNVRPEAFKPPPEVMSSVFSLVFSEDLLYPLEDKTIFHELTGTAFRQRRKMVRNTLIPYMLSRGISKEQAFEYLSSSEINPVSRPETLSVEKFVRLSNTLKNVLE